MKERVILVSFILVVLCAGLSIQAQSFTFQTTSTSQVGVVNSEIIFDFPMVNLGSTPLNVHIVRLSETIPSTWSGTMCFGQNCFPSFIDSVESEQVAPGDTVDYSYHFFTDAVVGNGTVTLVARNSRNLSDSIMVTLNASTSLTGINENQERISSYSLEQNYPNPFNPSTKITFSLPQRELVKVQVYDVMGREVALLINQEMGKGYHNVPFIAAGLSSGTYFYKITAGSFTSVKKMILLK